MVIQHDLPLAFRWLGTAGFQLRLGTVTILIDPFLSRSQDAFPNLNLTIHDLAADAIFVTHGHFDHACDVPTVALHTRAPVYASAVVCQVLHDAGVPARQLHPLSGGRRFDVGGVGVLAFPSRHVRFDLPLVWRALGRVLHQRKNVLAALRQARGWPVGEVLGYRFAVLETSVVHLGSAGWIQQELVGLDPDVALLPLQGRSDIHRVALRMVELLHPKCVIPHHHDDFFPPFSEQIAVRPFFELVHERMPAVETVEPRIGEWMSLC
ncbi:MAG: MBL fold metallo-hydrolase [Anaerolineae bacterium]|nr:MBL fold metallo-hydrolase [Anaerolineae bacterium]